MAGGMFTKQAEALNAKYLNDVNDSVIGGAVNTAPTGLTVSQGQQTLPGDRICLDDATALALSDTAVGTLYGGIYMYVQAAATSTAVATRGCVAFFKAADVGTAYIGYPDAQPLTTVPTLVLGIWLNSISKASYGWIQIAGVASVLYDSGVTANVTGNWVSAKVSASVASTVDVGAVVGVITKAAELGVSMDTITTSTVSKIALTRGFGRI